SAVWTREDRVVYRRWNTQLEPETAEVLVASGAHWPWLVTSEAGLVVSWVEGQSLLWTRLDLSGAPLVPPQLLAQINTLEAPRTAWNVQLGLAGFAWLDPSIHKAFGMTAQLDGGTSAPLKLYATGRRVESFDFSAEVGGWVWGAGGPLGDAGTGVEFFWLDVGLANPIDSTDVHDAGLPAIV